MIVGDGVPSGGEGGDLLCRVLFLFQLVLLGFLDRGGREFRFRDCQRRQGFLGEVAGADQPFVSLKDVGMSRGHTLALITSEGSRAAGC